MAKKFIVVGHPRSGSTFLIDQLGKVPHVQIPHVRHGELFNNFEKLFNVRTLRLDGACEVNMLNGFFGSCTEKIVGLKTIPSFHRQWREIASIPDIQFIRIARNNLLDCVASMLVSERTWSWQLPAREQLTSGPVRFADWFSTRREQEMILGVLLNRLLFDLRELERLDAQPNTISLTTELISESRSLPQLDEFFEQPVVFQGFERLTSHRECFVDADLFSETITTMLRQTSQYDSHVPRVVRDLVVSAR